MPVVFLLHRCNCILINEQQTIKPKWVFRTVNSSSEHFSLSCLSDIAVDHQALLKQFEYLNHMNPHTFEVEDLDKLIKSVRHYLQLPGFQFLFDSVAVTLNAWMFPQGNP